MIKIEKIKNLFIKKNHQQEDLYTQDKFINSIVNEFLVSHKRFDILVAEKYYNGEHDILDKKRTAIGQSGQQQEIMNLPNNKIVDNQYKKLVVQKVNYLLGKPILFQTDNLEYSGEIAKTFNKKFNRMLNYIGTDSINCGIGYMYIYYDESGSLSFRRFSPYEIIPIWKDSEKTELSAVIRVYDINDFCKDTITKIDIYTSSGILEFERKSNKLKKIDEKPHLYVNDVGYNWEKLPIIPFKYNRNEKSLISMVKTLQDAINKIISNFQDNMEEDARNSILVLVNYDGENLGEFRRNLSTYGAVKVSSQDGKSGDVRSLQVEVNADNYKAILQVLKKAMIENAMGYDAKDDRLSGTANQMNIQSMYNDIDLDANSMELEFQASMENILWFLNKDLHNRGIGDFKNEKVDIIFNKDMIMNESEIISSINNSKDILSIKTLIEQHPWVTDSKREFERLNLE